MSLVAEGWGAHISKGYIYSAMAFSVIVEILNLRMRSRSQPVHLHESRINQGAEKGAADAAQAVTGASSR